MVLEKREFYIDGQWVSPAQANDLQVIDPSNEQVCAVISLGAQADTDAAVAAARAAFDDWSQTSVEERIALLEKLLGIYMARSEQMAALISMEMGAPIALSRAAQVGAGSYHFNNFIRALKSYDFERPLGEHAPDTRILHEAIGVCALITPWNWPMNQVALKVVPALAAGCTVILKPSEISPLSSMLLAEMIDEAGFPCGVFNLVNGDGAGVGSQLSGHPDIDMVSFTGSTRAEAAVSSNAAEPDKRTNPE